MESVSKLLSKEVRMALHLSPNHPSLMVPKGSSMLFVSSSSLKFNIDGVCVKVRSTNITNYKRTY
jgi:hypothetical protein